MDSTSADSEAASTSGNVRVFYIIFWSFFLKFALIMGLHNHCINTRVMEYVYFWFSFVVII